MSGGELFSRFEKGKLYISNGIRDFSDIQWSKHPKFDGVELKHLVQGAQTKEQFSYHLVRIAPGKKIGLHTHATQLETHEVVEGSGFCINEGAKIAYESGIITFFPIGIEHEVEAGPDGLLLFAKFFPSLC